MCMGKRKSGALAGKTKMSERNQFSAADAAVINAIDWDKVALQKVIHAANQRRLGGPLTKWLAEEGWNLGKFVVKENFVVDTSRRAKVKISGLGSNFRNWFLNTVENLPPAGKLGPFILPEAMYDKDIITKLGGVAKAITSMGEGFWSFSRKARRRRGTAFDGQHHEHFLCSQPVTKLDGHRFSWVNLDDKTIVEEVRIRNISSRSAATLCARAVSMDWYGGGRRVGADSVERPGGGAVARRSSQFCPEAPGNYGDGASLNQQVHLLGDLGPWDPLLPSAGRGSFYI